MSEDVVVQGSDYQSRDSVEQQGTPEKQEKVPIKKLEAKPSYWMEKFSDALHQEREVYNRIKDEEKRKFLEEVEQEAIKNYNA